LTDNEGTGWDDHLSALLFPAVKRNVLAGLLACALLLALSGAQAGAQDTAPVLDSAEFLFKMMKARDYKNIWVNLSAGSKSATVNDVYRAVSKSGVAASSDVRYSKDSLARDFESGGPMAKAYWDSYLESFNPDLVLEQSKWTMGEMKKARAEILIHYRGAEGPVHLQMIIENGKWKVALTETFSWSGR
jgi:hypothetical protein